MRSAGASVAHLVEPSPSACCSISASSLGQIRIRAGGEGILSTLDDRAFRCLGPPRRGGRKNPSLTANKFAPKSRRGNSRAPDGAGTINGTRAAHVSPTWSEQSVLYQTRWLPSQRNAGLKWLIGLNCPAATRDTSRCRRVWSQRFDPFSLRYTLRGCTATRLRRSIAPSPDTTCVFPHRRRPERAWSS